MAREGVWWWGGWPGEGRELDGNGRERERERERLRLRERRLCGADGSGMGTAGSGIRATHLLAPTHGRKRDRRAG
ncbi:MAG TPA: hypothetical protein VF188_00855 [Longimicrobiales bacterium]